MFSPSAFQHELSRFRHQMNHIFRDFDRAFPDSFAVENDPYCMEWSQPLGFDRAEQNALQQGRGQEQKESGEQKYTADAATNGTSNQMAVDSTPSAAAAVPGTSNATAPPATATATATAPGLATAQTGNALAGQPGRARQPLRGNELAQSLWRPWGVSMGWPRGADWLTAAPNWSLPSNAVSIPRTDVLEKDDQFLVSCELPGMSKEEVKVSVSPSGVLSINAEHSEQHEQKDEKAKYHRVERSYGKYSRSMQLPDSVDAEQLKAKHENGVLHITLPKKPKAEPKAAKNVPIH